MPAQPRELLDLTRWIFLRGLGLVYGIALVSFWTQVDGLVGSQGILPATQLLGAVAENYGPERYWLLPTVLWLDASDVALHVLCAAGVVLAALATLNIAPAVCFACLWAIYLSIVRIGGDFLSFQWDILLLEAGFLAILWAPWRLWPRRSREPQASRLGCWLVRLLAFRLLFSSGVVKLLWGDPTWLDGTALLYHYETQPLPTAFGWWAQQLPAGLQKLSCLAMYAIEVVLPFAIFGPRRARQVCCVAQLILQGLIAITGNYNFFNLLTALLCLALLDDGFLRRLRLPRRPAAPADPPHVEPATVDAAPGPPQPVSLSWIDPLQTWTVRAIALPLLVLGGLELEELLPRALERTIPAFAYERPQSLAAPLCLVNGYGLFRVMTTERREIVIEGSDDGREWREYEFRWKPGDVARAPGWCAPHQPRLDWQMWFAALGSFRGNPWFQRFLVRLLEGSPPVLALLEKNPFPQRPPRYLRAVLYRYHMTGLAARRATGAWWRRELLGAYSPTLRGG